MKLTLAFGIHAFLLLSDVLASPIPQEEDICTAEPLTLDTWEKLGMEKWLTDWATSELADNPIDGVQNFSSSVGAPNFFCGLSSFCNAGQPCFPIDLPAWHALLSVQNWNTYVNTLYNAVSFAANIISLTLPGIVADVYPDPKDDVTVLKLFTRVFGGTLGTIPFTGALGGAATVVAGTTMLVSGSLIPPEPKDRFLAWTNVASSMGILVQSWHSSISSSFQNTIEAQASATNGIVPLVSDGKFLGTSQSVTQAEMQEQVVKSLELYAIGLALQAQRAFVFRSQLWREDNGCREAGRETVCVQEEDGQWRSYSLVRPKNGDEVTTMEDVAATMQDKYGMTKQQMFKDVSDCFDDAGGVQLVYPFGDFLPLDSSQKCIFHLQVCTNMLVDDQSIMEQCKDQGLSL